MKSTFGNMAITAITLLSAVQGGVATQHLKHTHQHPSRTNEERGLSTPVLKGCFDSAGGSSVNRGTYTWQTSSYCGNICFNEGYPVAAITNSNLCYCASLLPNNPVSASECSMTCPGFPDDTCGGPSAYNVWLTGTNNAVGTVGGSNLNVADGGSSSSEVAPVTSKASPSTVVHTSVQATTIIRDQETIIQTISASAPASTGHGKSGGHSSGNTIGIAVGVVVGILGLAALIAFTVFYLRRRRRMKNAENGHARADSLNAFVAGGSTHMPVTVPQPTTDSRLDPRLMVERRRMSAGSVFADNEDYSRRILKVTNPEE